MPSFSKALLPFLFFGYAALVNATMVLHSTEVTFAKGWWKSDGTGYLDQLYSEHQPHRALARGLIGAARYLVLKEGREGVVVGPEGILFSSEEFRAPLSHNDMDAIINEVIALAHKAQAGGAQVIVLFVPQKAVVFGAEQPFDTAYIKHRLIKAGVPVFDATDSLGSGRDTFFKTDTHWTPSGAETVAEAFARVFPALKGRAAYSLEVSETKQFSGDLTRFITTEAVAPWIGLAHETVAQVQAIDQQQTMDLFAQVEAHALVGTSYSADIRWGFVEHLKLSLAHDVVNYAKEGQGPLAPMRSFLTEGAGEKVVIWEFPMRYFSDPELLAAK